MLRYTAMEGLYQHRLTSFLLGVAVVVSTLGAILVGLMFFQSRQDSRSTRKLAASSTLLYASDAFSTINHNREALIESQSLQDWVHSNTPNQRYFHAISLWKELREDISRLNAYDYSFAVTSSNPAWTMVITKDGSTTKDDFKATYPAWNEEPSIIPISDEKGNVTSLCMTSKAGFGDQVPLIVTIIDINQLLPQDPSFRWAVLEDGHLLFGSPGVKDKDILGTIAITGTPWSLGVSITERYSLWLLIPLVMMFVLAIVLFCTFFFQHAARKLYQPFTEALSLSDKQGPVDEFAVIRMNGKRVQELSTELEAVLKDKDSLREQALANQAIQGLAEDDGKMYMVACFELDGTQDMLAQLKVEGAVRDNKNYSFLRCASQLYAIIIQDTPEETAKRELRRIAESSELQIALSEPVQGRSHVHDAFMQAKGILEYRYQLPISCIITKAEVGTLAQISYHYPISLEQQFLQAMLLGTDTTELEASIKDLNKDISPVGQSQLVHALAATIERAFHELHTTSEDLYGVQLDWQALLQQSGYQEALDTLFFHAGEISKAVHRRGISTDDKMAKLMQDYIHEHYAEDIMLQDLADHFNLSVKYCSQLFKRLSNDKFRNYLNSYRMEKAKEILAKSPGIKTSELGKMVGFTNSTSFIRAFNRYVHLSPKAYASQMDTLKKVQS